MKVLVVRLSALGDVAVTANAVYMLKKGLPDAEIHWLVEEEAAPLVLGFKFVDKVIPVSRRRYAKGMIRNPLKVLRMPLDAIGLLLKLRKGYDAVLDFQGNFRSGLLTFLSGAKKRIGFSAGRVYEGSHIFYTIKVRLPKQLPRVERMMKLLDEIGVKSEPFMSTVPFEFTAEDRVVTERFLYEQRGFNKKLVVVHPGTSRFADFKRWPVKNYARLCCQLACDPSLLVVVTWGKDEWFSAVNIVKEGGGAVIAPRFENPRQLAYLLSRASLFIGGDTGPLHIAALFETPSVALFGPKDPQVYKPWNRKCVVLRGDVKCSP
ncbi:MAG: glycosyltransferase family 9 protein, partial [Planctomycetota bacterium]|nr:glycosyltransferase family 9 protein [Planctomycetota bacterium]